MIDSIKVIVIVTKGRYERCSTRGIGRKYSSNYKHRFTVGMDVYTNITASVYILYEFIDINWSSIY